ncbi:MAG: hypothetical protein Q7S22_00510 [Candidatus Micrarchaeota archaeon]|nr:hypothetical protein [Candidatus Micrarchaeota archaeon]
MHLRYLLLFFLIVSAVYADFQIQQVDVTIKNINKDGSVLIQERYQFLVKTAYSKSLYESIINKNDLSSWSLTTGIRELRLHTNPNAADITNFRLKPQPLKKCNAFVDTCRGELIIEYTALPFYNKSTGLSMPGTGIFSISNQKPRTTRYTLNPSSLYFDSTDQSDLILDEITFLNIEFPENSLLLNLNPVPEDTELKFPTNIRNLSWSNIILVKFAMEFEVEESLDKEVTEFFSDLLRSLQESFNGGQGLALIAIVIILTGSYIYLRFKLK